MEPLINIYKNYHSLNSELSQTDEYQDRARGQR